MYSALQQQCLQQLDIPLYQLKSENLAVKAETEEELDWAQVAEKLIEDIKVLFPQLYISGNKLTLNSSCTWLLSKDVGIKLLDDQLHTANPDSLSVAEKKQVWQKLAQVKAVSND